jgi:hypothetical protein
MLRFLDVLPYFWISHLLFLMQMPLKRIQDKLLRPITALLSPVRKAVPIGFLAHPSFDF